MRMQRRIDWCFGFLVVTMIAFISGCGAASDQPELGTVHGVVTMDGKPLANVIVAFEPVAGGRASMGKTDAEGSYELVYSADAKGAVVGSHRVTITAETGATDEEPDPSKEAENTIPAKYSTETTLNKEVKAGDNTIDFELTSS